MLYVLNTSAYTHAAAVGEDDKGKLDVDRGLNYRSLTNEKDVKRDITNRVASSGTISRRFSA
jgi:hypothetical protein